MTPTCDHDLTETGTHTPTASLAECRLCGACVWVEEPT